MPRKLIDKMPLDDLEDEIMYTIAALKADENTQDFIPTAEGWMTHVDEVRATDREVRQTVANVDAARMMANEYLDQTCVAFGDDLYYDVDKDRKCTRWTQFFPVAVSAFVRQPLSKQVNAVRGWLASAQDPVLEQYRSDLEKWVTKADDTLVQTSGLAGQRARVWAQRESLAELLTNERDVLRDLLAQRARELKFSRTWPDLFFRTSRSSSQGSSSQGSLSQDSTSQGSASQASSTQAGVAEEPLEGEEG